METTADTVLPLFADSWADLRPGGIRLFFEQLEDVPAAAKIICERRPDLGNYISDVMLSEMAHRKSQEQSPEPWHIDSTFDGAPSIRDANHSIVAILGDGDDWPRGGRDSRRIVACVNALAGIPSSAVESGAVDECINAMKHIAINPDLLTDPEYQRQIREIASRLA